jgi:hypothetical protein
MKMKVDGKELQKQFIIDLLLQIEIQVTMIIMILTNMVILQAILQNVMEVSADDAENVDHIHKAVNAYSNNLERL